MGDELDRFHFHSQSLTMTKCFVRYYVFRKTLQRRNSYIKRTLLNTFFKLENIKIKL